MQSPGLTLKIELFGGLIEQLNHWHLISEEDDVMDSDYVEFRFIETLSAIKEMRAILIDDLTEYINDCKLNQIPIDLGYYRVKKQLDESTFELFRS